MRRQMQLFKQAVRLAGSVLACSLALVGTAVAASTTTSKSGAQAARASSVTETFLSGSTTASPATTTISPDDNVVENCDTLPGETCHVVWTVGVGETQISFLFSDGEDITGEKENCVAPYKSCTYNAYGVPSSYDVAAVLFHVSGTNVHINSITGQL